MSDKWKPPDDGDVGEVRLRLQEVMETYKPEIQMPVRVVTPDFPRVGQGFLYQQLQYSMPLSEVTGSWDAMREVDCIACISGVSVEPLNRTSAFKVLKQRDGGQKIDPVFLDFGRMTFGDIERAIQVQARTSRKERGVRMRKKKRTKCKRPYIR